jgi:hypothetical protein
MKTPLLCAALALAACQTVSPPPDQVGQEIVTALEEGRSGPAARAFEAVEDEGEYRELIYPVLYDAARRHYTAGELEPALEILRFMEPRYPEGSSVRLALAYSLFLQYSQKPSEGLRRELDGVLAELRSRDVTLPAWVDLFETQVAIDDGRLDAADESFEKFLASWDGSPASLAVYVEDVGRYLASH